MTDLEAALQKIEEDLKPLWLTHSLEAHEIDQIIKGIRVELTDTIGDEVNYGGKA